MLFKWIKERIDRAIFFALGMIRTVATSLRSTVLTNKEWAERFGGKFPTNRALNNSLQMCIPNSLQPSLYIYRELKDTTNRPVILR